MTDHAARVRHRTRQRPGGAAAHGHHLLRRPCRGRRMLPCPAQVTEDLRAAGWIDGPWRRDEAQIRALEQLPVTVESWEAFDRLFDWRSRPVAAGSTATCATYLGAAVRRFFAQGGRRAIVVRVGDPWPYMEAAGSRAANRDGAHRAGWRRSSVVPSLPFDPTDPRTWRGLQHLYGLPEASLVCLPDLADACARRSRRRRTRRCRSCRSAKASSSAAQSEAAAARRSRPALPAGAALRCGRARRLDRARSRRRARSCVRHRRDVVLIGALPLMASAAAPARSARLPPAAGRRSWPTARIAERASSAFVQLAYPWLSHPGVRRSAAAARAAGRPARRADRCRGARARHLPLGRRQPVARCRRHRAGGLLGPRPRITPGPLLAERVCLVARQPDGWALQSDVTTSPDSAWRAGGVIAHDGEPGARRARDRRGRAVRRQRPGAVDARAPAPRSAAHRLLAGRRARRQPRRTRRSRCAATAAR